ncbi:DMT family transporter [Oenococcus oeni]|uniref:DMT family transporter n=1 Tax=Oenococcus oeni TaxID=1247 RepID=UPI00050D98FE|nr:DMT family transporter [Oenococcus oeni]KGH72261.1 membrane protein [Oenococcus oeni IOEB_0502]
MMKKNKKLGLFYGVLGPFLWGINGVVTQYLLKSVDINVDWLLSVRLLFAGTALFLYVFLTDRKNLFRLLANKQVYFQLIIFIIFGDFLSQYTYIIAIAKSNAALATILTSLNPVFVIIFYVLLQRRVPQRIDIISVFVALLGTFFLVTHGSLDHLEISPAGLFWGLFAAAVYAFGTIYPIGLIGEYGPLPVTAISLFASGIVFNFYRPFFISLPTMSIMNWSLLIFFTIISTALGTAMWFLSLHLIGPTTMSLLSAVEPMTAMILSVLLLSVPMELIDYLGAGLVILMIILQSLKTRKIS